jgi:hypothetical protein
MSVQGLRQPLGSSSPTSTTAAAPPHITCTASAAAGFAASTFVLVQYDFAINVIASSSTSLLLQPPTALAPLHRSASRNRSGALSASPSIWHEVHTGPALRMLGASKTAACLRPRRVLVPGKLGSAPHLYRPRQRLLRHQLLRLPRPRHRRFFLRTRFWQNRSMPTPQTWPSSGITMAAPRP